MTRQPVATDDPVPRPLVQSPGFVGRERELAALTEAFSGPPAVVLVEGEAGIGKSRLLREVLATPAARKHRSMVAVCPPFRQPFTLGVVVDALRQATSSVRGLPLTALAGALRPFFPEWATDLPAAPEQAEDATASRHRLFRALAELLGCLQTAVLVVEDAHWADDATLEFLLFLVSRQHQVNLVVTYRPEDVAAESLLLRLTSRVPAGANSLRLTLEPLDLGEIESLVSSMFPGAHVSTRFAAFLHQHTGGVPLAVEESVRLMYDRADLARLDGAWVRHRLENITVPPTIRDAVLERARRLGPDAHLVVRAAAVLAEPADEATLLAVTGLLSGRGQAGLVEALDCGLLHENGRGLFGLRHVLACQAVHEAIPRPLQRTLHQRAAQALQTASPPPVARLAYHHREAGDNLSWSRFAEAAAIRAMSGGDDATADSLLHEVITTAHLPARRVARLSAILPCTTFRRRDQLASLVHALRDCMETSTLAPEEEADIRYQLGRILIIMGDYRAAQVELEQAVPQVATSSFEAVRAMNFLGLPHGNVQPASVHLAWLRRAERVMPAGSPNQRLRLLVVRVAALLLLGEESGWTEARQMPSEATVPDERKDVVAGHLNIGHLSILWGRYPQAARHVSTALRLSEKYQHVRLRDNVVATQAYLSWLTGDWDGLADTVTQLANDEEAEAVSRGEAGLVAGLLEAAAGNHGEADRWLRRAHAAAERSSSPNGFVEAAALAKLWLTAGRVADALAITDEPAEIAVHKGIWLYGAETLPVRVEALAAADRIGEADGLVAAFASLLEGHDAPSAEAALVLCRAILGEGHGRYALAAALFDAAARCWHALPRPYDALLARERQARCLLATGDADGGLALLADVFQNLSALGARGDAIRVIHLLRQHGIEVKRPWWGGRRGYGDQLSPRELDVARALVDGSTNRQIAEALFLSPKTVARHLDAAMRKMGVTSRTALAVKIVEADSGAATPPGPRAG